MLKSHFHSTISRIPPFWQILDFLYPSNILLVFPISKWYQHIFIFLSFYVVTSINMCVCLKPTSYKIFSFILFLYHCVHLTKKNYVCKVHTEFSDSKLHVVCLSRDFQHRFIAIPAIVQVCLLCDYPRLTQCLSLVLSYAFCKKKIVWLALWHLPVLEPNLPPFKGMANTLVE